jgi:lysozyme
METSEDGHAVMHYFEQCRLQAYPDPATGGAPWTIGWGDTGPDVVSGLVITQAQADARFAKRLGQEFEPGVRVALVDVPRQCEFDAMVCLAYNIGLGNFKGSSVVRRFNMGNMAGAADAFLMWDKAAGKTMRGLVRRRAAERALFLGSDGRQAIEIGKAAA